MKRPLSDFSDEEREEAVARAKRGAASLPPSVLSEYKTLSERSDYFKGLLSEVYNAIDRAFDVGVNPRKGKHTKVEFMLPRSLAIPILLAPLAENQIIPKSMVLTRFSHQKQTTVLEVRLFVVHDNKCIESLSATYSELFFFSRSEQRRTVDGSTIEGELQFNWSCVVNVNMPSLDEPVEK